MIENLNMCVRKINSGLALRATKFFQTSKRRFPVSATGTTGRLAFVN
jgi:hypothetical protein